MSRISTIELSKESMKFSAAHFTIFDKEQREHLHGHNYQVYAAFTTLIGDEGLSFDYRHYKNKILTICKSLHETTILPAFSKYLEIEEKNDYIHATFNNETMKFLKRDALILPITNSTVEELSNYILNELLKSREEILKDHIEKIVIKVSSGPGRFGSASWEK